MFFFSPQDALDFKNLLYERLDGSMRGTLRQESLLRFSQPETETLTPGRSVSHFLSQCQL